MEYNLLGQSLKYSYDGDINSRLGSVGKRGVDDPKPFLEFSFQINPLTHQKLLFMSEFLVQKTKIQRFLNNKSSFDEIYITNHS